MITITDEQFNEYLRLKSQYNFDSARSVSETLEGDIDEPVRETVALLALLGCEPVWSCCGYDYAGQPCHKAHSPYGTAWVRMKHSSMSASIGNKIVDGNPPGYHYRLWRAVYSEIYNRSYISVLTDAARGNTWPDTNCVHFSEGIAIALSVMNDWLRSMSGDMADEVVLRDYNEEYRERFPKWEYPPKKAWVVKKSDWVK